MRCAKSILWQPEVPTIPIYEFNLVAQEGKFEIIASFVHLHQMPKGFSRWNNPKSYPRDCSQVMDTSHMSFVTRDCEAFLNNSPQSLRPGVREKSISVQVLSQRRRSDTIILELNYTEHESRYYFCKHFQ